MIAAGHQSHYLPWLGYVDKIKQVDVFCLIDTIPFEEKLFQHRNRIRTDSGEEWLVVPVIPEGERRLIKDLAVDNSSDWAKEHWQKIHDAYNKAPHFTEYEDFFREVYNRKWEKLVDLNEYMLRGMLKFLEIDTKIVRSQDLEDLGKSGNILLDICTSTGADTYMSGAGGNCSELDEEILKRARIEHVRQEFTHPEYPQVHGGEFISKLAMVDLLFNCGEGGKEFLAT